jgi:hypothetical protein
MEEQNKQPKKRLSQKEKILKALEEEHGVVTSACKRAGISRAQYYKLWNADSEFREQCEEVQESAVDYVESQLFKNMQEGNVTAQIFYLKTKGKHRGYIEKTQVEQEITGSIKFQFD